MARRNDRMSPRNIALEKRQTIFTKKEFNKIAKNVDKAIKAETKSLETKQEIENSESLILAINLIITDGMIQIVNRVTNDSGKSIRNGNNFINRTQELGIDFNIIATQSIQYLENLRDLNLSNRQGSITRTTRDGILKILRDGLTEGLSPDQIAKNILDQTQSGVLSLARARMIAVNEIGKAYEFGKKESIDEFVRETGTEYEKSWLTARDDRVTETHRQNARDGWINKNQLFSGTGDQEAPGSDNPRCRCTTLYRRRR